MSRLTRFEDYRFIGVRDAMILYDCDDAEQFNKLSERVVNEGLAERKLLQSFAPDTEVEARNRGFRPDRGARSRPASAPKRGMEGSARTGA